MITRFSKIGITVTKTREDIRTRMPTPDEAHTLKTPSGVPVFYIQRTHYARRPGRNRGHRHARGLVRRP